MAVKEIIEDSSMENEERELVLCTESARDNIKKVLDKYRQEFSQNYSMPSFNSVYQRFRTDFQANKNKSTQQLAVESYCVEMGMTDTDKIKMIRLVESIT
ncbi:hypothetical protein HMPREF1221_01726 [Treponema socranskii subsp. paredis ATCC 35535]|nr:hypothetical protein HMPREF1221_01726 [Treponema socranskii subsp. paredis ATCC 35535]